MRRLTSSLMVIAGLLVIGSAARAVDITECGQVIPQGQVGNLVADLDCTDTSKYESSAITLRPRATLNLNSFSLIGPNTPEFVPGVDCHPSPCEVNGPGTIEGFRPALRGEPKTVRITDVNIIAGAGESLHTNRLILTRCTVSGGTGIITHRKIRITDSVISDSLSEGISDGTVLLRRRALRVLLRNTTVTANDGDGISAMKVIARDSVIVDNGGFDISVSKRASLRSTTFGTCSGKCVSR